MEVRYENIYSNIIDNKKTGIQQNIISDTQKFKIVMYKTNGHLLLKIQAGLSTTKGVIHHILYTLKEKLVQILTS